MKSNKVKVFEFIYEYSISQATDEYPKLTTQYLSEKLKMQRTNLSSILNQLVKEGKIIKTTSRPVLYQLVDQQIASQDEFMDMIGYDQSLSEAVSLAKAAILYPQGSPCLLINGQAGSGIRYFAKKLYDFAVKSRVLKNNASFIVFDCQMFIENLDLINEMLFGDDKKQGLVHEANQGMLLVKHAELLSGYQRTLLFSIVSNHQINSDQYFELPHNYKTIMLFSIDRDANKEQYDLYHSKMDFVIDLPTLSERSLKERFALLELFLKQEAKKLDRVLEVSTSILHSLMLYEVSNNIHGLKNDVHTGVANCYVREHNVRKNTMELLLSDFPNYVRKGMIFYKTYKEEIDLIIQSDCKYAFTGNEVLKSSPKTNNIYRTIDGRVRELKKQSISEEQINRVVSLQLHQDFKKYLQELNNRVNDRNQLTKIVSEKLIHLVESFINNVSDKLAYQYPQNILYGLCLHINASLIKVSNKQRLGNEEIKQLIDHYPDHYQLAKEFIHQIEDEFNVVMNIDEVIITMLFLINDDEPAREKKVVTLIAMHGDSSASSIAKVVNTLTLNNYNYGYDLPLNKRMDEAYDDLKQLIITINQGKGIILVYDMGSIRTMAESIGYETGIEIKYLEMPITLIGIASSNKANDNCSIDEVYDYLQDNFKDIKYSRKQGDQQMLVINAVSEKMVKQVQNYLNEHFDLTGITLYPIVSSDDNDLYNEINNVSNVGKIIGIIGEKSPKLAQFAFITIDQLYQSEVTKIADVFTLQDEIDEIFVYLKEQFKEIDIDGIKDYLMMFVDELAIALTTSLNEDERIGLIVHLVCLIDRINQGQATTVNFVASRIIVRHSELVEKVRTLLTPLEAILKIKINDSEIATIISIVKKE